MLGCGLRCPQRGDAKRRAALLDNTGRRFLPGSFANPLHRLQVDLLGFAVKLGRYIFKHDPICLRSNTLSKIEAVARTIAETHNRI